MVAFVTGYPSPVEYVIPREGFSVLFYFDATILFSVLLIMMQCGGLTAS